MVEYNEDILAQKKESKTYISVIIFYVAGMQVPLLVLNLAVQ